MDVYFLRSRYSIYYQKLVKYRVEFKEVKTEPKQEEEKVVTKVVKVVEERCCEEDVSLDEKIRRIRAELNLPDEKQQARLMQRLEEYESRYRVDSRAHHDDSEWECKRRDAPTDKYAVNVIVNKEKQRRSRSKSAERSRAKSAERPAWKPTGGNVYTRAHGEIVLNRRKENQEVATNTDSCQQYCEPSSYYSYEREPSSYYSYEREPSYYVAPPPPVQQTYYTTEYKPAQTTVKTTVKTFKNNSSPYSINACNSAGATLPTIKQTVKTFQSSNKSRPISAGYFHANSRSVDTNSHHFTSYQGQQSNQQQQVYYI